MSYRRINFLLKLKMIKRHSRFFSELVISLNKMKEDVKKCKASKKDEYKQNVNHRLKVRQVKGVSASKRDCISIRVNFKLLLNFITLK